MSFFREQFKIRFGCNIDYYHKKTPVSNQLAKTENIIIILSCNT